MGLTSEVLLFLTYGAFFVTSSGTRTFNVTSLDGIVRQLHYPLQDYSECLYREQYDVLYCMDKYSYREVVPVWTNEPIKIKYVKVNCRLTNQKGNGTCFCKDRTRLPDNSSGNEKYYRCVVKKLDAWLFNSTSSIEVLDLADNLISDTGMDRFTFSGLTNLRYCNLDRNLLYDLPDKLFCQSPKLEFISMNGLRLEHFPSHGFRCSHTFNNLTVLEMRDSGMKDIPRDTLDYLPNLLSLDLGGNNFGTIYKASFSGAAGLKHLNLSDNSLSDLFPHFCTYMKKLSHLHLSANVISVMSLDELDDCALLVDIDLSRNMLTSLTGNASSLTSLQKLNVSRNNISTVDLVFPKQGSLFEFDISQNQLMNLDSNVFIDIGSLKYLNLSNNLLKESSSLPALFAPLVALETLDLGHNKFPRLVNNSFSTMTGLKTLLLTANMISDISGGTFNGLGSLETLTLDHNTLTSVTPDLIKPLTSLKYLSLSSNSLASLDIQFWPTALTELYIDHNSIPSIPSTIPFSSLEIVDASNNKLSIFIGSNENLHVNFAQMKSLNISHNRISDMSPRVLQTMTAIESLSLDHNLLQLDLSLSLLQGTTNLTFLNLAVNKIQQVDNMFSTNSLDNVVTFNISGNPLDIKNLTTVENSNLETLDISRCNISSLDHDFFWTFSALKFAHVEGNSLETFPTFRTKALAMFYLLDNPLICMCNMTWLLEFHVDVAGTPIPVANFKLPKCSVYTQTGLFNPKILRRSQYMCVEEFGCDAACSCYKTNQTGEVVTTACNNNNLNTVPSGIPRSSLAIFLDGNDFSNEAALSPLLDYRNMAAKELYMNSSAVSSLDPRVFTEFGALEVLSLNGNLLERLPTGIFTGLTSLKHLFLHNNLLHTIGLDVFSNLPKLDELDISGNNLAVLSDSTLSDLALLEARYFFLADNPWACNCSNRAFKMFVDKIEQKIRDRRSLFCDRSNREILQLSLSSFRCVVRSDALSKGKPMVIVGVIIAVLVGIVSLAVSFYFRRELVALLYYKTGCRIPGRRHSPGKHFDVYVSYDVNDQHCSVYVQNTLLPKLKNNSYNYQTSGDVIEDAEVIQKMIEDSKVSVFIVNKNFSSSPFQVRVLQAADLVHKKDKFHNVVLIIHGDIELNAMDTEVTKHLRHGDYITSRSRLWWERLVYELPVATGLVNNTAENDDVSESDVIVFSSLSRDHYENI